MVKCKRIDTGSICSESAVDAVSMMVADGWKVLPACRKVVAEYKEKYPDDAPQSVAYLKNQFYDAQKTETAPKGATNKKTKKEEVPPTNMDLFVPVEKYNTAMKEIKSLKEICIAAATIESELNAYKKKYGELVVDNSTTNMVQGSTNGDGTGTIKREAAFAFIKDRGNEMQRNAIAKMNLDNEQMFKLLKGVKTRVLENNPPQSIPADILNATGIE